MALSTIEWLSHVHTDGRIIPGYTYNPWRGCTKRSAGCQHCYALRQAKRNPTVLGVWGPNGTRVAASAKYLQEPDQWNREAAAAGERRRVFCASMADVFEGPETCQNDSYQVIVEGRARLWPLIEATPHLDWLLLTKRPENILTFIPQGWRAGLPANIWIGTSVENQAVANERIPLLVQVPAVVRFLSCEPLLGPIDLLEAMRCAYPNAHLEQWSECPHCDGFGHNSDDHAYRCPYCRGTGTLTPLQWIIGGGESGPEARPCHPEWARGLRNQCVSSGVPFFFKQWGEWKPISEMAEAESDALYKPAPARDPEAVRDCRVPTHALQYDGGEGFYVHGGKPGYLMFKVGKAKAGHLLDGREWKESPQLTGPHPKQVFEPISEEGF